MERAILLTGIGGQGIQLAARTLAEAAVADGRRVQLFASYGGMMRGGNSDSFVVVGDGVISSPPVVGSAWAALVMHHEHAAAVWPKLEAGALAVINQSVVEPTCRPDDPAVSVVEVDAVELATTAGAAVAASLVMVGALVARTGLVSTEALLGTVTTVLPSYRQDAAETNRRALEAGLATATLDAPAWEPATA